MKHYLRYIIGAALIASTLIVAPVVWAVENNSTNDNSSNDNSSSTNLTTNSDDNSDNAATETKSEFTSRMDKLKTKFKVKLGETEKRQLKLRCRPAQSVVAKLNTRFGNSVTKRTQAYTELSANLDKLIAKLKAKGVNTTTLEQQKTELDNKISSYKTDLAAYQQSLTDLKNTDCVTDPDAFKAALEAARAAHETLVNDAVGIKTYLLNTIKPSLQSIRKELESQAGTDSSDNNTSEGTN